ncbi:MAG: winged helix-turn-helix transcriptional regulator [Candidatus Pacebacteria bacterium]|nr:winged helix-turn-helix transcriptional regulator [Candidatus Paceibacterota bacterium]
MKKTYRELERIIKGVASHRRIQILDLLYKKPEMSAVEIAEELSSEFKNISAHINKMATSGLVMKRSAGSAVRHKLTNRGKNTLKFVRTLE